MKTEWQIVKKEHWTLLYQFFFLSLRHSASQCALSVCNIIYYHSINYLNTDASHITFTSLVQNYFLNTNLIFPVVWRTFLPRNTGTSNSICFNTFPPPETRMPSPPFLFLITFNGPSSLKYEFKKHLDPLFSQLPTSPLSNQLPNPVDSTSDMYSFKSHFLKLLL